jgi:hypothetical protein
LQLKIYLPFGLHEVCSLCTTVLELKQPSKTFNHVHTSFQSSIKLWRLEPKCMGPATNHISHDVNPSAAKCCSITDAVGVV